MPNQERHLAAAQENEALAYELLERQLGLAWIPVLGFYSALHLVDGYFATRDIHPRNHVQRRAYISREAAMLAIEEDYSVLERISRDARYELAVLTESEARLVLEGPLRRVRELVQSLLNPSEAAEEP